MKKDEHIYTMQQFRIDELNASIKTVGLALNQLNDTLGSMRIDLDILSKGQQIMFNQQEDMMKIISKDKKSCTTQSSKP